MAAVRVHQIQLRRRRSGTTAKNIEGECFVKQRAAQRLMMTCAILAIKTNLILSPNLLTHYRYATMTQCDRRLLRHALRRRQISSQNEPSAAGQQQSAVVLVLLVVALTTRTCF
jgi:hypothetical protein